MNWFENLPPQCPPTDALPANGRFYRIAKGLQSIYNNMKQNTITIERVLDYCDVPQLFIGRDKFDTQYICLLYDDEDGYKYTAIRISNARYSSFVRGETDLRTLFVNPEYEGEYFDVLFKEHTHIIVPSDGRNITEDRLPSENYYMDNEEIETLTISIPKHERNFFERLIHQYGWVAM